MGKQKHATFFKSDLHGISPLPLDAVAGRLSQLDDDTTDFELLSERPDEMLFQMRRRKNGHVWTSARGKLRRWQGTHTRIDIDGRLHGLRTNHRNSVHLLIALLLGLMGAFLLQGKLSLTMLLMASAFAVALFLLLQYAFLPDLFAEREYAKRKALDRLMQDLADAFTDDSSAQRFIEADAGLSEKALHRLIEQKQAAISLTSDGELHQKQNNLSE